MEQLRESFNFEKKKTQNFAKSAEISAEFFFQVAENEMYVAEIKKKKQPVDH